jgi:polar amino acid transport system substrate-binding protein
MTLPHPTAAVLHDLAPSGTLRAAINYGNTVLVQGDIAANDPGGVSPALARALATRLAVPLTLVPFPTAGQVFDALPRDAWDVCFLAVEPVRAAQVTFTAPYVVIEATYLVRDASPIRNVADADRSGIRIAAGEKSAYDLYLTRNLRHATLVREPGLVRTFERFAADKLDAMAGIRQQLDRLAQTHPGHRVLADTITAIQQAMGTPAGRPAGAVYLQAFVEEMKRSGFVAAALAASGQTDAQVAPPADAGSQAISGCFAAR